MATFAEIMVFFDQENGPGGGPYQDPEYRAGVGPHRCAFLVATAGISTRADRSEIKVA